MTTPPVTGLMHEPRWKACFNDGAYIRVTLDGQNITTICLSADDRAGWALVLNSRYDEIRQRTMQANEIRHGEVKFEVITLAREPGRGGLF